MWVGKASPINWGTGSVFQKSSRTPNPHNSSTVSKFGRGFVKRTSSILPLHARESPLWNRWDKLAFATLIFETSIMSPDESYHPVECGLPEKLELAELFLQNLTLPGFGTSNYTVSHKKTCHFIFQNNFNIFWNNLILFEAFCSEIICIINAY